MKTTLNTIVSLFLIILFFNISAFAAITTEWTRIWGSAEREVGYGGAQSCVDSAGNIYVTGYTQGEFDGETNAGFDDICLTKHNSSGSRLWTRIWGGELIDRGEDVCVDSEGSVYVAGHCRAAFDGQPFAGGGYDIFLTKFNSSGTKQWTRIWGTDSIDRGYGVCADSAGNVYVAGGTQGALDGQTHIGLTDVFLTKYSSSGAKLWTRVWAFSTWVNFVEQALAVCVDPAGNVYVVGETTSSSTHGWENIFITKLNSSGFRLWSHRWGASHDNDSGEDVCLDDAGNIYVAGSTYGEFDGQTNLGSFDLCLSKFDPSGARQWSRIWGSDKSEGGHGVSIDSAGDVYVAGSTSGGAVDGQTPLGATDFCLTKFTPSGEKKWTRLLGSSDYDMGKDVSVDANDNVYFTGSVYGGFNGQTNAGDYDLCLMKLSLSPADEATYRYVWAGGSGTPPYTNWATAANTLQPVIDEAQMHDIVIISNGLYTSSGYVREGTNAFVLEKEIELVGRGRVVIDGQNLMRGAYVTSGKVENVIFENCRAVGTDDAGRGGGVFCEGNGTLHRCRFVNNMATEGGGAYLLNAAVLKSCLVVSNNASGAGGGVALHHGGTVYNLTIVDNSASAGGGGLYCNSTNAGMVVNTIIYDNLSPSNANVYTLGSVTNYSHCCTDLDPGGLLNITNSPELQADYSILEDSPCQDSGATFLWMYSAADLAGESRVRGDGVDIGAYEAVPEPFYLRFEVFYLLFAILRWRKFIPSD